MHESCEQTLKDESVDDGHVDLGYEVHEHWLVIGIEVTNGQTGEPLSAEKDWLLWDW